MDSVSIIVTALVLGAANGLKDVAAESIKDAYASLKQLVVTRYTAATAALSMVENDPNSELRQGVLEEDLAKTDASDDSELIQKAEELIALANSVLSKETIAKVGVEIKDVEGGNLEVRRIQSPDRGVVITSSKFQGDISVTDISVSSSDEDGAKKK